VAECLPNKHKGLSSNASTGKKKKTKEEEERKECNLVNYKTKHKGINPNLSQAIPVLLLPAC
jgi:hypothetical protein